MSFYNEKVKELISEKWSVGTNYNCVITDSNKGLSNSTGHAGEGAKKYYGGNLICESVWREKDAALISAAPDMLEALCELENDNCSIPKPIWDKVQNAIKKALGEVPKGGFKYFEVMPPELAKMYCDKIDPRREIILTMKPQVLK